MDDSLQPLDKPASAWPEYVPPILLGRPSSPEWVRVADLIDLRTGCLRAALDAMATVRGYPDPITIGAGFALITTGAMAELVWRAVRCPTLPALLPETTWWNLKPSANVHAIAIENPVVLSSPTQLGPILHKLLDGLYTAVMTETGFPIRAQWSLLASAIAQWLVEGMPDDHSLAIATATNLFTTDKVLNVVKPRVTWFEHNGHPRAFTTRRVCCFNYRGKSGGYCTSQCPIVPADQRLVCAIESQTQS